MSRYVIKFSKDGVLRYISHLDLLRLFKRSFKRVHIKLQHSQGFNPHPKMSFAQPLSLGYASSAEYLEFETAEPYSPGEIQERLRTVMAEGIELISVEALPKEGKTLAALTEAADYEISIPLAGPFQDRIEDVLTRYVAQDQILVQKHQKKSGKEVEIDIKPMIHKIHGKVDDNFIMLTVKLAAGSTANLSPEILLSSFGEFAGLRYDRAEVFFWRTELYFHTVKNN